MSSVMTVMPGASANGVWRAGCYRRIPVSPDHEHSARQSLVVFGTRFGVAPILVPKTVLFGADFGNVQSIDHTIFPNRCHSEATCRHHHDELWIRVHLPARHISRPVCCPWRRPRSVHGGLKQPAIPRLRGGGATTVALNVTLRGRHVPTRLASRPQPPRRPARRSPGPAPGRSPCTAVGAAARASDAGCD